MVSEHKLVDGAVLRVPGGIEADRTGKQYTNGLDPDEKIEAGPNPSTDDNDLMVAAALRWLIGF